MEAVFQYIILESVQNIPFIFYNLSFTHHTDESIMQYVWRRHSSHYDYCFFVYTLLTLRKVVNSNKKNFIIFIINLFFV